MENRSDPISVGSEVCLELTDRSGEKELLKFVIVEDNFADFSRGFMSEKAPLAKAVLGERSGTVVPYLKDDILSIEIISVNKPTSLPADDRTNQRSSRMMKTLRAVEDTNAMVFASSFSGKWGDYDPDSLPKDRQVDEGKPDAEKDQKKNEV